MITLFPYILGALKSKYAVIRQCAARCVATLCDVFTTDAMRFVVENVIPRLGDPLVLSNRQGAMELIASELSELSQTRLLLTFLPV